MQIKLTSLMVDDQERALQFYTHVLGFVKKHDIPVGEFRWLTVVSPEAPGAVELSLEPNVHPAAKPFQQAMRDSGIPLAAFETSDLDRDCARLEGHAVVFRQPPADAGPVRLAIIEDGCGNLIQIYQPLQ